MPLTGRKHPRCDDDQPEETMMVSLYDLCSGDLSQQMLSYLSPYELCTFDALSKNFQALTDKQWKDCVYKKTGMKNGKADWKKYNSFLDEPISVELVDEGDHGYGSTFAGTPRVATNGSIVVMTTDDPPDDSDPWSYSNRTYPSNENEIMCVRDGYSLNFSRLVSSSIRPWRVELCGGVGCEIIVASNCLQVAATRGNDEQMLLGRGQLVRDDGILLLGCETHLIVCVGDSLNLYQVETDTTSAFLLSLKKSVLTTQEQGPQNTIPVSISWANDKSSFVYCCVTESVNEISVWSLDVAKDTLEQMIVIQCDEDVEISNIALGDEYVFGASKNRDIHIWNRFTGEKLPHLLCDVKEEEEDDRLDPDDIVHGQMLWCCGHILISDSHFGTKLCIWDGKSGELLGEHELERDALPDGGAITSVAYLPHLNGFLLVAMHVTTFIAFPTNKRQVGMAKSIKRREERIKRAIVNEYDLSSDSSSSDSSMNSI